MVDRQQAELHIRRVLEHEMPFLHPHELDYYVDQLAQLMVREPAWAERLRHLAPNPADAAAGASSAPGRDSLRTRSTLKP